jgi:indolepyruvate ferredoxin oxidoreductase beta subunit
LSKNLLIIPATEAALECGGAIMANIVMLGALAGSELLLLPKEDIIAEVKESVPADKVSMNLKAFEMGFELSQRSSVKHLCPS